MPEKGTIIPLAPSAARLEAAKLLSTPQNFVPATTVNQGKWASGGPARQMIPVGVVGELGASYTVFEKNWRCDQCQTENYASKQRCLRCRARKPEGGGGLVHGEAAPVAETCVEDGSRDSATAHGEWKEIFDVSARHLYYVNAATGETQWERPLEMGPTPHASGWFGRGAAGSTAAAGYERNNEEYLNRSARKQVEYLASQQGILEGANEYNLWFGKFLGDHWDNQKNRDPAETRCVLATDAGRTKADAGKRSSAQANFCLFFARGCCALGVDCRYFHRIPVKADLERFAKDEQRDCFGRERHKDFKDDMTGVGALMKPCRTLFIGCLLKAEYADPQQLEQALWRNLGEWGEVENINIISRLSICFVRYRYRTGAEFAKEALSNNHLDHGENLNVRWAHDDPNPVAHEAAARADADALVEMLKSRGVAIHNASRAFDHPADYHLPAPKRLKTARGDDHDAKAVFPDTDAQYNAAAERSACAATAATAAAAQAASSSSAAWKPVQHPAQPGETYWWNEQTGETSLTPPRAQTSAACDFATAALDAADAGARAALAANLHSQATTANAIDQQLPPGWSWTTEPTTNAPYFFNSQTGETTWERPSFSA